jgi:hypothetical protein
VTVIRTTPHWGGDDSSQLRRLTFTVPGRDALVNAKIWPRAIIVNGILGHYATRTALMDENPLLRHSHFRLPMHRSHAASVLGARNGAFNSFVLALLASEVPDAYGQQRVNCGCLTWRVRAMSWCRSRAFSVMRSAWLRYVPMGDRRQVWASPVSPIARCAGYAIATHTKSLTRQKTLSVLVRVFNVRRQLSAPPNFMHQHSKTRRDANSPAPGSRSRLEKMGEELPERLYVAQVILQNIKYSGAIDLRCS